MSLHQERLGEVCLFITCLLEGLFPIVVHAASGLFPPILFVGVSSLIAACILGIVLFARGELFRVFPLRVYLLIAGVALFIVMALVLIFVGTRTTSSISTALLLQAEMLFTFLFAGIFLGEKLRRMQGFGLLGVLIGTLLVLYNGTFVLNPGDVLILLPTMFMPIGNFLAKRALEVVGPLIVLFYRYVFAALPLLGMSMLFEGIDDISFATFRDHPWILFSYSIFILVLSKTFWYEGLKRLDLGKAVYIVHASPAFSLLFAFVLLREIPTIYQFTGFIVTILGVYLILERRGVALPERDLV